MKIKAVSGIMLTLLFIGMLTLAFNIQLVKAEPKTIIVPDDYPTIQDAINAASPGDTIQVAAGTYYENVVVNKSLTLVGENRSTTIVDGGGTESVITVTQDNINITGFTTQNSGPYSGDSGIYLNYANYCNISNNNVRNNVYGIYLDYSSNNTLTGNTASHNSRGIFLDSSSNNTLAGNTAYSNNYYGIYLSSSSNNILAGNNASNNPFNFRVDGEFNNYVDTSNAVDGKPIYYLIGVVDAVYDAETNAGTIYLINCNNITIKDLTLTRNWYGAFLWKTTNSKIENVTASYNQYGIWLSYSSNNTLTGNTASNNNHGIYLSSSSNNILAGNTASNKYARARLYGIYLFSSSNNVLSGNTASPNNERGIYLDHSSNNTIAENTVCLNSFSGIDLDWSSYNTISNNNASSNNYYGIILWASSNNNVVADNIALDHKEGDLSGGIVLGYSHSNVITHNTVSNNSMGIEMQQPSHNNIIFDNTVSSNIYGINLGSIEASQNITIYHNNIINNTVQAYDPSVNVWDNGYPSGGNYWSDHVCTGNPSDGSQPYVIDANSTDHYPFQDPDGWLPVANAGPDQTVDEDILVTFDGSLSTDNVGIVNYTWTFTDVTPIALTGVNPTYTFNNFGDFEVTLNVSDAAGYWATDTMWVYVLPDTTSPDIIDVSQFPFKNNVLPEDEVKVNATVTDELSGVKQVTLNYTNGNGTWITVNMTNLVGNVWNATIPAFPYGTNVTYRIIAEDNMNNTITTEDLGYEYQYTVVPEFPAGTSMLLILILLSIAIAIYKRRLIKTPIH